MKYLKSFTFNSYKNPPNPVNHPKPKKNKCSYIGQIYASIIILNYRLNIIN